jgi:hypothetical protein
VEQNVHIFKLKALRSPKRTDEIHMFHAVVALASCSDPFFSVFVLAFVLHFLCNLKSSQVLSLQERA